jgi:hypothetical protein
MAASSNFQKWIIRITAASEFHRLRRNLQQFIVVPPVLSLVLLQKAAWRLWGFLKCLVHQGEAPSSKMVKSSVASASVAFKAAGTKNAQKPVLQQYNDYLLSNDLN